MEFRGPEKFVSDGDAPSVSLRWRSWIEEFEFYAYTKGFFNDEGEGGTKSEKQARKKPQNTKEGLTLVSCWSASAGHFYTA
jgi:hypothetical protein